MKENIKRGQIYLAELGNRKGSIQAGTRPVVIVSNDLNNRFSPTVNVLPITSKVKTNIPVHVEIGLQEGLEQSSTILTEQVLTINKTQLLNFIGLCNSYKIREIDEAILLQNGIDLNLHLQAM